MNRLDGIPRILYKYRVWKEPYHKRLLTENEIFLASPANLNDPFDASLPFKYNKEELVPKNIIKKLIEVGRRAWPNISEEELYKRAYDRLNSGVFEDGNYWKKVHADNKKKLHATFGILSLTTKNDNLLMWAHYADSHRGMCIGLNSNILFEVIKGTIGPVVYSDAFPEISLFNEGIETMVKMLNTKSKDWKYEDEYRLTKINSANMAYKIPSEAIEEIILGCNMTFEDKKEVHKLRDEKLPHIKLYEAEVSLEKFNLEIKLISNKKALSSLKGLFI